ncbi:MFS transporter [Propioniciclava sinopodophylli]|uniref:MFS transporter n=1 Tax=Propioniciclava sinopodophylli TaxID=1837344 RepID=A0A4Q9KDZ8_9ACTN|nr:glycoside-pentoside-hexuronide (GPH):cation symporter [Propioniciclava sinopodophylli]TBT83927.1 MFS transporter [Propioniciclava sinopodophylli]
MDATTARRNRWSFAVGTVGRDMVYSMMALFLIVYLTEVLDLDDATLWWVNGILLAARIFDAFTDIVMGGIIDNTRTRWGQFKPWIVAGMMSVALITILLFTDLGLRGPGYVALFAVVYIAWGLAWTMNDIGYWSMLPALTFDQRERERLGALAKVFATIGLFTIVVAIIPVTGMLGGDARAWQLFTIGAAAIMVLGQLVTLVGVREPQRTGAVEHTTVRDVARAIGLNDQLLWTALAMVLFLVGYNTTTSFGVYFFKYAYRDENMFSPFAAILGVAQLLGFALFPLLRKRFSRKRLFSIAMGLVGLGYLVFFFSPMDIVPIGIAGLLLFVGASFVIVLMTVFLTDCIEYGQWKLGHRNGAVTFALQPFINKIGGAVGTAIVGATLILTGINAARTPDDVTEAGLLGMRLMMMGFPMVLMLASYLIYLRFYRIDEAFHAEIVADLRARGQLADA